MENDGTFLFDHIDAHAVRLSLHLRRHRHHMNLENPGNPSHNLFTLCTASNTGRRFFETLIPME